MAWSDDGNSDKFYADESEEVSPYSTSLQQKYGMYGDSPAGKNSVAGRSVGGYSVEEKFERIFRVNREMRDEILVYDPFLTKFWTKIASKCRENAGKIWILRFSELGFRV